MALPVSYDTVEVRGTYVDLLGQAAVGQVTFTPSAPVIIAEPEDVIVIGATVTVVLDGNGSFSVRLPATDDPDVDPQGFTYAVTEQIRGVKNRTYAIAVPIALGGEGLDIADASPAIVMPGVARPYLLAELGDVDLDGLTGGQGIGWNPAGLWEPRSFETTAGAQAKAAAAQGAAVATAAADATAKADTAHDQAVTDATALAATLANSARDQAEAAAAADAAARVLVEQTRASAAEQTNATAIAGEATTRAAQDGLRVLKAGDTMSGDLAMGAHRVTGLLDPAAGQDAATRAWTLAQITALINGAPGILDTLGEIATQLQLDESAAAALATALATETTNRTAADNLRVLLTAVGAASGVAALDANARLPLAQKALRVSRAVTATTNFATGDDIIVAGGTTAYNVALPSAVTFAGREFTLKRKSTGVITLTSAAGLIDDAATFPLNTVNQAATVYSDGTDWQVI